MPAALESRPTGSELASKSWQSLRQAFKAMPVFYVSIFLCFELTETSTDVITAYPREAAALISPSIRALASWIVPVIALQVILSMACIAVAAVATHRFILLNDDKPRFGRITLRFFGWLIAVKLVFNLPALAASLGHRAMPDSGSMAGIYYAVLVAEIAIAIYCAIIFPSVAVEEASLGLKDRVATSWSRMDGNFWLFVRASIIACLPIILTELLIVLSIGLISLLRIPFDLVVWDLIGSIIRNVLGFPIWMVQVAIASWLYAWMRQAPEVATATS